MTVEGKKGIGRVSKVLDTVNDGNMQAINVIAKGWRKW